jgi:hypothetical protein
MKNILNMKNGQVKLVLSVFGLLLFLGTGLSSEANTLTIDNKTNFTIWAKDIEATGPSSKGRWTYNLGPIRPMFFGKQTTPAGDITMGNENQNEIKFYIGEPGATEPDPNTKPLTFRLLQDYNSPYARQGVGVSNPMIWTPFVFAKEKHGNPTIKISVNNSSYDYVVTLEQQKP